MKKNKKTRTADRVLIILAVTTVLFVIANYISFWKFQSEQSTLITAYFGCVGVELAALIGKRIVDKVKTNGNDKD